MDRVHPLSHILPSVRRSARVLQIGLGWPHESSCSDKSCSHAGSLLPVLRSPADWITSHVSERKGLTKPELTFCPQRTNTQYTFVIQFPHKTIPGLKCICQCLCAIKQNTDLLIVRQLIDAVTNEEVMYFWFSYGLFNNTLHSSDYIVSVLGWLVDKFGKIECILSHFGSGRCH
jgi:hypothetical protein